jgi:tRNA(Arg) A34 adenosine deaminase TadA
MLTNKQQKIVRTLFQLARDNDTSTRAKLVAAVVYKNQIVSFGFNSKKSHPFVIPFQKNEDAIYLHAETDAIKNALRTIGIDQLTKCDLYVVRAKYTDKNRSDIHLGMAKPCKGCARCISQFGIKRVIYSTDEQSYAYM